MNGSETLKQIIYIVTTIFAILLVIILCLQNSDWKNKYDMSRNLKIYKYNDIELSGEPHNITIEEAIKIYENEVNNNYYQTCIVQRFIVEHTIKFYYERQLTEDEDIFVNKIPTYICEDNKNRNNTTNNLTTYEKFNLEKECIENGRQKMLKNGIPQGNNDIYSIYIYGFYSPKINKCIYVTTNTNYENTEYNQEYEIIERFDCDGGCAMDIITAARSDKYFSDKLEYFDELVELYK